MFWRIVEGACHNCHRMPACKPVSGIQTRPPMTRFPVAFVDHFIARERDVPATAEELFGVWEVKIVSFAIDQPSSRYAARAKPAALNDPTTLLPSVVMFGVTSYFAIGTSVESVPLVVSGSKARIAAAMVLFDAPPALTHV